MSKVIGAKPSTPPLGVTQQILLNLWALSRLNIPLDALVFIINSILLFHIRQENHPLTRNVTLSNQRCDLPT